MWHRAGNHRGQVTVETAVLFGTVVAGLVALAIYLQRGVQGGIRSNADSLGTQFSATTPWNSESKSHTVEGKTEIKTTQDSTYKQDLK